MVNNYLTQLENEFQNNSNAAVALSQKKYLKNNFDFFGIVTPLRRELQKPFLEKKFLPSKEDAKIIITQLWARNEREFQLFAQELFFRYKISFVENDIDLLEFMVVNKSWWDTVDHIAANLLGQYFKAFPDKKNEYVHKWLKSGNMWLQRSAILFQLKYKHEIDTQILASVITFLIGSKEFFINKAIGWILREYSRTNPTWVIDFVEQNALSPLSKREALRLL